MVSGARLPLLCQEAGAYVRRYCHYRRVCCLLLPVCILFAVSFSESYCGWRYPLVAFRREGLGGRWPRWMMDDPPPLPGAMSLVFFFFSMFHMALVALSSSKSGSRGQSTPAARVSALAISLPYHATTTRERAQQLCCCYPSCCCLSRERKTQKPRGRAVHARRRCAIESTWPIGDSS